MSPMIGTVEEKIANPFFGRPHVVILGAGASRASFPKGEATGRRLPLVADLVEDVGLHDLLRSRGVVYEGRNLEDVFSDLHEQEPALLREVEQVIHSYFAEMLLPHEPSLYDHLVLSLREKDVLATFNWDPLLFAACARNHAKATPPYVLHLHGNVALGYCAIDRTAGSVRSTCRKCGGQFRPSRLIYPIRDKDYAADPFLASQWTALQGAMKEAYMLTIFGYSAPKTDVKAMEAMKAAWGRAAERELEEIEIVNLGTEDELRQTWADFILSHHYRCRRDFFDSWLAKHPRRSCEAMWNQTMECKFIGENAVPRATRIEELWEWYAPLLEAERSAEARRDDDPSQHSPVKARTARSRRAWSLDSHESRPGGGSPAR